MNLEGHAVNPCMICGLPSIYDYHEECYWEYMKQREVDRKAEEGYATYIRGYPQEQEKDCTRQETDV